MLYTLHLTTPQRCHLTIETQTSTGDRWTYGYDLDGRMVTAVEKTSGGTSLESVTCAYDALDNRIGMAENGTQTWTLDDSRDPIMDFRSSGSLTTWYLWGPTGSLPSFPGNFMRTTLRVFIMSVLVLGLVLGSVIRSARVRSNAVATLRRAGAAVFYDWEPEDANRNRTGAPAAPSWLVNLIGVDFFGGVRTVQIDHGTQEAVMPSVGRLTSLQKLDLFSSPVTDPDLRCLRSLDRLRELSLSDTEIGDAGLAHLSKLSNLERLNLMRTRITGAGLLHLKGLASIRDLALDSTSIGDAGLAHLKDLKTLDFE
jgi:Leucine-rich repeat (LRR) protein